WFFAATYLNHAVKAGFPRHWASYRPIGVDLGQRMLAVAVDPVRNRRMLLSGKDVLYHRKRYERILKRLRKAGTPAARRAAKQVEAKYARFLEHRDRRVANAIIRFAVPPAGATASRSILGGRLAKRVVIK